MRQARENTRIVLLVAAAMALLYAMLGCEKVKDPVAPTEITLPAQPNPTPAAWRTITAKVQDGTLRPIPYAKLTLSRELYLATFTLYANSGQGTWSVPEGPWNVVVSAAGYAEYHGTVTVDAAHTAFLYILRAM